MKGTAIVAYFLVGVFCTITANACGIYVTGSRTDWQYEPESDVIHSVFDKCSKFESAGYLDTAINLLLQVASDKARARAEMPYSLARPNFMQNVGTNYRMRLSSDKIMLNLKFRF